MVRSAQVPPQFEGPFSSAETYVEKLFATLTRNPEQGTLHIGGDRYVLIRAESLFLAWYDAMEATFGTEAAAEFIYNTARELGRNDCRVFCQRLQVTDGVDRLAAGPLHFAHAGWARVEILADSAPSTDDSYYLHYYHPNTFESEVLRSRQRHVNRPACQFSAGYSAGWCSDAFGLELHARELSCLACGGDHCEFVMAPSDRLDDRERECRQRWTAAQ